MAEASQTPVYFWRETDGETGYLSQWYFCPFRDDKDDSKVYETAEHYMMHHKALLFGDEAVAAQVLEPGQHPRTIKNLGRKVKDFDESKWQAARYDIVRRGNLLKFTRAVTEEGFRRGTSGSKKLPPIDGSLRQMLLATAQREIVEASPYDRIWGIGFAEKDADRERARWGLNLLGKALVDVRDELNKEAEGTTK